MAEDLCRVYPMQPVVGYSMLAWRPVVPSVFALSAPGLATYARAHSLQRRHRLRPWHVRWPFLRPIVLSSWPWGLPPLDHSTLAPTPPRLALSLQRRSPAGPTLTWWEPSAGL